MPCTRLLDPYNILKFILWSSISTGKVQFDTYIYCPTHFRSDYFSLNQYWFNSGPSNLILILIYFLQFGLWHIHAPCLVFSSTNICPFLIFLFNLIWNKTFPYILFSIKTLLQVTKCVRLFYLQSVFKMIFQKKLFFVGLLKTIFLYVLYL